MTTALPADPTIPEMRVPLIEALLPHVPFDGWTFAALDRAAGAIGLDPATARLAFPDGPAEIVDCWIEMLDGQMTVALAALSLAEMKVRQRFEAAILVRLEHAAPHREAMRRATHILALPANLLRAGRIGWRTADAIWRAIGEPDHGLSFHSRRLTAMAVETATLLVWLDDDSADGAQTRAFLERRIGSVMRIERIKGKMRNRDRQFSMLRFLGRLRYPQQA
jgi:ubiquinone biosynthesis protein COQ9